MAPVKGSDEARAHFDRLEEILIESKQAVVEENARLFDAEGSMYGYESYAADCRAYLRLMLSCLITPQVCNVAISSLKQGRMIHPQIRTTYSDYVAAQNLLIELDQEAETAMKRAGL